MKICLQYSSSGDKHGPLTGTRSCRCNPFPLCMPRRHLLTKTTRPTAFSYSKPCLSVNDLFCSFDVTDAVLRKRESLALVLGLSKAKVIDVHRGAASRLYLTFLNGKLEQKWTLEAVDHASLKVKTLSLSFFWPFHASASPESIFVICVSCYTDRSL